MSVIVKGMKMPKNCLHCDFDDSYGICACRNEAPYVCEYSAKQRPSWCPLEEVPSAQPETHDKRTKTHSCDLIDRQAAINEIKEIYEWHDNVTKERIIEHFKQIPSAYPDSKETSPTHKALDTISRQAAIDAVGSMLRRKFGIGGDLAEITLAGLPSAQQTQQRWIPCSERLPEEDGDYWVTADPRYVPPGYRSTDVITWRGGKWVMADYFVLDGEGRKMPDFKVVELAVPIIAWMPLPEPYREEGD